MAPGIHALLQEICGALLPDILASIFTLPVFITLALARLSLTSEATKRPCEVIKYYKYHGKGKCGVKGEGEVIGIEKGSSTSLAISSPVTFTKRNLTMLLNVGIPVSKVSRDAKHSRAPKRMRVCGKIILRPTTSLPNAQDNQLGIYIFLLCRYESFS